MSTTQNDIISQLEALSPKELKRVSNAVHEKLCAETKYPPGYFVCMGYVGVAMQIQAEHRWKCEKELPLTAP